MLAVVNMKWRTAMVDIILDLVSIALSLVTIILVVRMRKKK